MIKFSSMRGYLLFWLTFSSLIGVFVLAFTKGTSVDVLVPAILGIYAAHSGAKQISAHVNARMDADGDVEKVIEGTKES